MAGSEGGAKLGAVVRPGGGVTCASIPRGVRIILGGEAPISVAESISANGVGEGEAMEATEDDMEAADDDEDNVGEDVENVGEDMVDVILFVAKEYDGGYCNCVRCCKKMCCW